MRTDTKSGARATAANCLADAARALAAAGIVTARLDSEVLLACACDIDRSRLLARVHDPLAEPSRQVFVALLQRRLRREPLQYIVGRQEFWSLDFLVTPEVLIPRAETEVLVEWALAAPTERMARPPGGPHGPTLSVCDVGTGSGCIAVTLARELPSAAICALDRCDRALVMAARNAQRHGVAARIEFARSDLFTAVGSRRFDMIVCNPPYVKSEDIGRLQPELRWEPRPALDGGRDGLSLIERVLHTARAHLWNGGWLLMEIGATQAEAASTLARAAGWHAVSILPDMAGRHRVLRARR